MGVLDNIRQTVQQPQIQAVDPLESSYSEYKNRKLKKKLSFPDFLLYKMKVQEFNLTLEFYNQLLDILNNKEEK